MELLRGRTVGERLRDGAVPLARRSRSRSMSRRVAHAHTRGIVHRDVTPGNVFLCEDGQVKVLDFGMAAFGRHKLEGGTVAYMAPEQWSGATEDERTDVFALGVVLYEMIAGAARSGTPRT
jgi:serine/threonine protein kinase